MEASDFLSDEEFSYFSTMISGPCQKLSFFLSLFLLLGKLFGQGTQGQGFEVPGQGFIGSTGSTGSICYIGSANFDDLLISLLGRLPGESRGPEHIEITGFRLSPE
jgi:hypothetical protein